MRILRHLASVTIRLRADLPCSNPHVYRQHHLVSSPGTQRSTSARQSYVVDQGPDLLPSHWSANPIIVSDLSIIPRCGLPGDIITEMIASAGFLFQCHGEDWVNFISTGRQTRADDWGSQTREKMNRSSDLRVAVQLSTD
jgi:hypothetical protein